MSGRSFLCWRGCRTRAVPGPEASIQGHGMCGCVCRSSDNFPDPYFKFYRYNGLANLNKSMNESNTQQYQFYNAYSRTSGQFSQERAESLYPSPASVQRNSSRQHIAALPIIYDSPSRNRTPTKQDGNSRIIYDSKNIQPQQDPKIVLHPAASNQKFSPPPPAHLYETRTVNEGPASNSRVIIHQVQQMSSPVRHEQYQLPPQQIQRVIQTTNQPISYPGNSAPIPYHNQSQGSSRLSYQQAGGNSRIVSHLSSETVPRIQYDRCVIECKNWETKYNELYLKHLNLSSLTQEPAPQSREVSELKEQNRRLRKELEESQRRSQQMMELVEQNFTQMLNRQKEATLKECGLLLDRYRLQTRQ